MSDNRYCGYLGVPEGYKRGSPKHCTSKGQIRYYGVKQLPKEILDTLKQEEAKIKRKNAKIKKRLEDIKYISMKMISDAKELKQIIGNKQFGPLRRERASEALIELRKQKDELVKEREKLKKQLKPKGGSISSFPLSFGGGYPKGIRAIRPPPLIERPNVKCLMEQ